MKKQNSKLLPIVYILDLQEPFNVLVEFAFHIVEVSSHIKKSQMKKWLTSLELFTDEEFDKLKNRATDIKNKQIPLNQKHLEIWYAVLWFSHKIFSSEIEFELFVKRENIIDDENQKEFRDSFLGYTEFSIKLIQENFKINYSFEATMSRINEF